MIDGDPLSSLLMRIGPFMVFEPVIGLRAWWTLKYRCHGLLAKKRFHGVVPMARDDVNNSCRVLSPGDRRAFEAPWAVTIWREGLQRSQPLGGWDV